MNIYLDTEHLPLAVPPKPNKTYNKFFWWRRYQEHKTLHNNCPVMDKALNGDFDYSPYWKQIQYEYWFEKQELQKFKEKYTGPHENINWHERQISKLYFARRERLLKDAEKDEYNRLEALFKDMRREFGGNEHIIKEMYETFEGTIPEFIVAYKATRKRPEPKPVPNF